MTTPRKPRGFVLFDLTPLSLPILWLASKVYDDLRFVLCDKKIQDSHYDRVKRLGARQINDKNMGGEAHQLEFESNVVRGGERMGLAHPLLRKGIERYVGAKNGGELLDHIFTIAYDDELYAAGALGRFLERNAHEYERMDVFSLAPAHAIRSGRTMPPNVKWLSFHRPLVWLLGLPLRMLAVLALLAFPFLSALKLGLKGVRPGRGPGPKWTGAPFLFMHREFELAVAGAGSMHGLHNGALQWTECIHMPMQTGRRFTAEKAAFLASRGATSVSMEGVGCGLGWLGRRVFREFWGHLSPGLLGLLASPYLTFALLRPLAELIHLLHSSELILDSFGGRVVYFETENSLLGRALGALASTRGMRTASMLHGGSGQAFPGDSRARLRFDVLFTYGPAVEALRAINPHVGAFKPLGSWENAATPVHSADGVVLPNWLRAARAQYKVVGMLASFYHPITQEIIEFRRGHRFDDVWVYFDEDEGREYCRHFLAGFFQWVAQTPDVVLLWKIKRGTARLEYEHRWVKPLLEGVPKERIVFIDERVAPAQIIRECDIVVGTGASVFVVGMLTGVPTVLLDPVWGGWTRRYHPLLAAESGDELAACLDALFKTPLPREVFRKVGADWDVVDRTEDTPWTRMRRALLGLADGTVCPLDSPERAPDRKSIHA